MFRPKGAIRSATPRAMRPKPTRPRVRPWSRKRGTGSLGLQAPARTRRSWAGISRASDKSSAQACSATGTAVASGVLATMMPCAVASATGILSVPLPLRMIAPQRVSRGRISGVINSDPPMTQTTSASLAVSTTWSGVWHWRWAKSTSAVAMSLATQAGSSVSSHATQATLNALSWGIVVDLCSVVSWLNFCTKVRKAIPTRQSMHRVLDGGYDRSYLRPQHLGAAASPA